MVLVAQHSSSTRPVCPVLSPRNTEQHRLVIRCMAAIMNSVTGLKAVLSHPGSLEILAQSVQTTKLSTKNMARPHPVQLGSCIATVARVHMCTSRRGCRHC